MLPLQGYSQISNDVPVYNFYNIIIVTRVVKIDPNHTGTEIHFIAEH